MVYGETGMRWGDWELVEAAREGRGVDLSGGGRALIVAISSVSRGRSS